MEKTGLTRRQIFVFVTIILFFIAGVTVVYLYSLQNRAKNDIKEVVAKKIDRKDFEVTEIVVEADGWQLARIASTAKQDEGNPAMVILHEENNQLVLKFGPGTSFEKTKLEAAGVPVAIQSVLFGPQQEALDPIANHLPYQTNFYSVTYSGKYSGPGGSSKSGEKAVRKTLITITMYLVPRLNITDTPERRAKYAAEVRQWIQSLGLNPNDYIITFNT